MPPPFLHRPVLLDEVVDLLAAVPPGLVVDATVGGGGHAAALAERRPDLTLLGLDRDPDALAAASERLAPFGDRVRLRHARFDRLATEVAATQAQGVTGVLFDLGVSSPQLDRPERGFSFRSEGPLDMRMDPTEAGTADAVVNGYDAAALAGMLRRHADERHARRIAEAIVAARPISTTTELADVVAGAIPAPARRKGRGHPARRTFQAIRIEVNEELSQLADALDTAIDLLLPGGRCVVLSYHSGEDRVVKQRFRQAVTGGCQCPPGLPCGCGAVPHARLVVRGARKASPEEIGTNPRAESVRLRAIESIEVGDAAS